MNLNYAIASFFTFLICSFVGIFIYWKGKYQLQNRLYSMLSFSTALWAIGIFMHAIVTNSMQCLFWGRFSHIGASFVPIFYLLFIVKLIAPYKRIKLLSLMVLVFASIYSLMAFHGKFFVGVSAKSGLLQWADPGIIYPLFIVYFTSLPVIGFLILLVSFKSQTPIRKNQLRYVIFASLLGFIGGFSTFLTVYGIKVPIICPYGLYLVSMYNFIIAYAIIRHRLLDIKVVAVRTLVFSLVYVPILSIPFFIGYWINKAWGVYFGDVSWLIPVLAATVIAPGGLYIYLRLQDKAERRLLQKEYEHERRIRDLSNELVRIESLKEIAKVIVEGSKEAVDIDYGAVYTINEKQDTYELKYELPQGQGEDSGKILEGDNELIMYMKERRKIGTYEEVSSGNKKAAGIMRELRAEVAIPSFVRDKLVGLIILGAKKYGELYSEVELMALGMLANQAGFAMEDIMYLEEREHIERMRNEAKRLKEFEYLTSSIGHEIGNNNMGIANVVQGLLINPVVMKYMEESRELKAAITKMFETVNTIIINVRGVSEALSNFIHTRDIGEKARVDLREIAERVIVLLRVRNQEMKKMEIKVEGKAEMMGNATSLQAIFYNMLNNSYDAILMKRNRLKIDGKEPELNGYKGKIEIEIKSGRENASIRIRDNGIGMSDRVRKEIFTPLFTTKSHEITKKERLTGGTGIGMYTIQKLVKAHEGSIEILWTEEHKGAEFLIRLKKGNVAGG